VRAGTDSGIAVQLAGSKSQSQVLQLGSCNAPAAALGKPRRPFQPGQTDSFTVKLPVQLGELQQLQLFLVDEAGKASSGDASDNAAGAGSTNTLLSGSAVGPGSCQGLFQSGGGSSGQLQGSSSLLQPAAAAAPPCWRCDHVKVTDMSSGRSWWFHCSMWLGDGAGGATKLLHASNADPSTQLLTLRLTLHTSDLQGAGTSAQVGPDPGCKFLMKSWAALIACLVDCHENSACQTSRQRVAKRLKC
jgi:hypothetical protein